MDKKEIELFIANDNSAYRNVGDGNITIPKFEERCGWRFWKKRRYFLGMLVFFGSFICYMLRVNLSVAIVAMTKSTADRKAEFSWNPDTCGIVLSSFFYGYISTQILGGWLSGKYGGKIVFGCGIGVAAFLTLITPPLARISVYLLIVLRIVEGLFEGVTYPSLNSLWASWAPPLEYSKLTSLTISGSSAGIVFAMPVSGLIIEHFGWPAVFYINGFFGVIWFAFWMYFVTDKPEDDPRITQQEIDFIKFSINSNSQNKNISHPWKAMLSSSKVWAIFFAHFCEMWGNHTMVIELPSFMHDVLNFKIEKSGFFSALPYIGMTIIVLISGQLADYLRSKNHLTTGQVRKMFTCSGFCIQSVFIFLAAYLTTSTSVITCITIALSVGGLASSGFIVNYLDIAPKHASVLVGMGNSLATIAGIISPSLTGIIVKNKDPAEWRIIFIIIGVIYLFGAIIYGIFSSGEKQIWADDSHEPKSLPEKKEFSIKS